MLGFIDGGSDGSTLTIRLGVQLGTVDDKIEGTHEGKILETILGHNVGVTDGLILG